MRLKAQTRVPAALTDTTHKTTDTSQAPLAFLLRLKVVAQDIKLSHTVFAMPFAVLGAVLACSHGQKWLSVTDGVLILVCMFFARTAAMAMNRFTDARIDADNPRTQGRAVPSGQVSRGFMAGVVAVCGAAFIASAAGFYATRENVWPAILSPFVLTYLLGYGYTKRFTWLCHVYLGLALSISPVAAAIAMDPAYLAEPAIWLLALMVAAWVAGFDVIYALQDVACDREQELYSMPSRLGPAKSFWISRLLHALSLSALIGAAIVSPILGAGFVFGIALTAALLLTEHVLVWRSGTGRIHLVFFTLNGVISLILGLLGVVDAIRLGQ